jgi:hypothetical protein
VRVYEPGIALKLAVELRCLWSAQMSSEVMGTETPDTGEMDTNEIGVEAKICLTVSNVPGANSSL